MVLKCAFCSPCGMKRNLIEGLRKMPSLPEGIIQRGVFTADKEGRTSIIILYEFEESRLMEISRKIFSQRGLFSEISGFELSVQLWSDMKRAQGSIAEIG